MRFGTCQVPVAVDSCQAVLPGLPEEDCERIATIVIKLGMVPSEQAALFLLGASVKQTAGMVSPRASFVTDTHIMWHMELSVCMFQLVPCKVWWEISKAYEGLAVWPQTLLCGPVPGVVPPSLIVVVHAGTLATPVLWTEDNALGSVALV